MRKRGFGKWTDLLLMVTLVIPLVIFPLSNQVSAQQFGLPTRTIPDVRITELVPDTDNFAGLDAFEYVELYNAGSSPVDLQGYKLQSGSWSKKIETPFRLAPYEVKLIWTRRGEISPLTKEGFNSYYFLSYTSKHLQDDRIYIMEPVNGLVNSGSQTVELKNPEGQLVSRVSYDGKQDVSAGKSIVFGPPPSGSREAVKLKSKQPPTPGWIIEGQFSSSPGSSNPPQAPSGVQAVTGSGKASLRWNPSADQNVIQYKLYKNEAVEAVVTSDQHTFTYDALTGGVEARLQVSAVSTDGKESPLSEPVSVIPSHQPITQTVRGESPKSGYDMLWNISKDGPVIPGLAEDTVPQGIAYSPDRNWLVTVSYRSDGRPSILSVLDAATEKLIKSVHLYMENDKPYKGHAGGIVVSKKHVWVVSGSSLFMFNLDDLDRAPDGGSVTFQKQIPLGISASFAAYNDGVIWVGEFYESKSYPTDPSHQMRTRDGKMYHAWMAGYKLDPETDKLKADKWNEHQDQHAIPDILFSIPDKIQGAVVQEDTIVLSSSYGRDKDSELLRFNNPLTESSHRSVSFGGKTLPLWFLDGPSAKKVNNRLTIMPMAEGIAAVGNKLYVILESGATKYRYTTTFVREHMLNIDLDLWDQYGTASVQGIPEEVRAGEKARAKIPPEAFPTACYPASMVPSGLFSSIKPCKE